MVMSFLKKILGGGEAEPKGTETPPAEKDGASRPASPDGPAPAKPLPAVATAQLQAFVDFVVKALVDAPDKVNVTTATQEGQTTINIACEKRDIGKIIGKSGKTIAAIRMLVSGAGGKLGKKVNVEVLE